MTDDLTPAEMRSLLRSAQHVFSDPALFVRTHPNLVDRKIATNAVRKLGEAIREAAKRQSPRGRR